MPWQGLAPFYKPVSFVLQGIWLNHG
jgi:hypothetical protein